MAKLSSDGTYVTVESGDTLGQIAIDYAGGYSNYKKLAAINNISNPNLIYVGQKIYLTEEAASGGGSSSSTTSSTKPTITAFGLQSNANRVLFATWTWSKHEDNTDKYKISWTFDTGDGVWFNGNSSDQSVDENDPNASLQSTYSIPSNAISVRFKVKPIAKTREVNDVDTPYWQASWSDVKTWTSSTPLETPDTPSVEIEKFKLTASLDNIDINGATHIEFQVVKDNSASPFATEKAEIVTSHASHVFTIDAGSQYKVRCRAYSSKNSTYSEWSQYSANEGTIPSAPESITEIRAESETSVYIAWESVANATGYTVEYTTKKIYFDTSTETQSLSITEEGITNAIVTGMASGEEYFFRVRATNDEGESGWSEIKSVIIGEKPAAPTTWSSTSTAITGEPVVLYWVHNAEDGSSQTYAELQLYIGDSFEEYTIKNTEDEDEKDKTSQWTLDTSSYVEGMSVKWRVRTAGVTKEYGDWSIQRTIDIYAPATLELNVTNIKGASIEKVTSFPFYIKALAGPKTQSPIGYHVSIKSNSTYETTDAIGRPLTISENEEVYSKYFDITDSLLIEMSAGNIDLENGIEYTVTCTVSMNSGLTAKASQTFTVSWDVGSYTPNAEVGINTETMTASIRPYCRYNWMENYQVEVSTESGTFKKVYTKTDTILSKVWTDKSLNVNTTTGERVYSGVTASGEEVYFCKVERSEVMVGVSLSVYRREFDGSFTELATGLSSLKSTTVTDPHPALDFARYRIVATVDATGEIDYYDLPGYPVGGKSVIIQWDENWSSFETTEDGVLVQPPWSGSMLKLPYNIDVSESNNSDVTLVEYAGRSHPVTYYGTQLGVASSWNMEIPKDDKETIYALRRLARWMGDVYVREPSGIGYWANIAVSFSQKHKELTIPVSLSISQVEGGI